LAYPSFSSNEKTRWALDLRCIGHRRKVLCPDYLIGLGAQRGAARCQISDGRAIGDSTDIIAALEDRFPEPPLYPGDAAPSSG